MTWVVGLTRAQADALCAAANKLLQLPARGVDVGFGRHVATPLTWDGTGTTPAGWTAALAPYAHPRDGTFAVKLGARTVARMGDATHRARMTIAERTALTDAIALSVTRLPEDYQP